MIISSLCEYYRIKSKRKEMGIPDSEEIGELGYEVTSINYLISLNNDGAIKEIIPFEHWGKELIFPYRHSTEKGGTTTEAKALEYRARYIFGLNYSGGRFTTENLKFHKVFVESHLKFTEGMQSPLIQAFRKFVQNWDPEKEIENKCLLSLGNKYNNATFCFCLSGKPYDYLQDETEIKEKWEKEFTAIPEGVPYAVCPIYGEKLPVAKLHYPIIASGILSNRSVISYNNEAEKSYSKVSYNSDISIRATHEYMKALNYLLRSPNHHIVLGDIAVGYFALTDENEENYMYAISAAFDNVESNLSESGKKIADGRRINFSYFDGLDESVRYCILGYSPVGKGRIALKFFYTNTFGNFRKNIEKWHKDFAIGKSEGAPSFRKICFQLIKDENKKVDDEKNNKLNSDREKEKKLYSELTERLLNSAINAAPLSEKILETVIRRIKTDSDTEKSRFVKMNDTRIGLLKTCLNRRNKGKKEEITVSLNLENKNPAYLCGRLFAVLEEVQRAAADNPENMKTIKDTYFSSAAATPATVLPVILKLSCAHQAKLETGMQIYYNRRIGSILDDLEEFPKTLSLEQQGNFIIGYYQQNKDLYTAKADKEEL